MINIHLSPFTKFFPCVLYGSFTYAKTTGKKIYAFKGDALLGHF